MEAAETIDPRSFARRAANTDMRAAMKAIFSSLRTGCPWRYLPRDEFPPRSTVYNIFRKFQKDGAAHDSARAIRARGEPHGSWYRQPDAKLLTVGE
jgi:transposase